MSEEGFAGVEAGAGVVTGGVIQDVEQGLFVGVARQPGVRAGVVLPDRAPVAGLPAFDGLADGFVAGVWSAVVGEGPAADAGAIGFETEPAMEFTGRGAVGGGRFGGEQFTEQSDDLDGPIRSMIAAGASGRPRVRLTLGTGRQIVGVDLVEPGERQSRFLGGGLRGEFLLAMAGEDVTNEGSGETMDQL
jgi:hypothetical protein